MSVLKIILLFGVTLHQVQSFNILAVFPYEGRSHFFVFETLLRELASRGHNLTVISHFPQQERIQNYHDISLARKHKVVEGVLPLETSYWSLIQVCLFLVDYGTESCKLLLGNENVQQLWKSNTQFDLVLVEEFHTDCPLALADKLGAPVVALTSHALMPWHYHRFGIRYNPAYMSFISLEGGTKPSFFQRIERTIFITFYDVLYKYFDQSVDEKTIAHYFDNVPPLEDLAQNIRLLLLYQHPTLTGSNMLPANVKEVGGYHIAKPKELPADLKKFIDEAEHGVIYISFGSMLNANITPREILKAIIGALSHLPQRVIWKWDEQQLPGNPKNIYASKWLPQNDILAHPNVLAFYSHCGMLGTTEAIYHGVPMVGMPVFGDQPGNAALIEESGLGVQIPVTELSTELLLEKFKTVLDPKFRARVKQLSEAWHDRPQSPMDSAVYWTEYAARHKNISFKSAAVGVPFYQYAGLDVLAVLLSALFCFVLLLKYIWLRSTRSSKQQSRKKKN